MFIELILSRLDQQIQRLNVLPDDSEEKAVRDQQARWKDAWPWQTRPVPARRTRRLGQSAPGVAGETPGALRTARALAA